MFRARAYYVFNPKFYSEYYIKTFDIIEIYVPKQEDGPPRIIRVNKIQYYPDDILGTGSSRTTVFRGNLIDTLSNENDPFRKVAVKRLVKDLWSNPDTERVNLKRSDGHENVVRYYWAEQCKKYIYLALQLCDFSLQHYIEIMAPNSENSDSTKINPLDIFMQAVKGLKHLHDLNIVHCHLSPSNVLVYIMEGSGEQRAVISDLGLSKTLKMNEVEASVNLDVGFSSCWMAPELIRAIECKSNESENKVTIQADIFSMGCILYYIISSGKHPFGDDVPKNVTRKNNIIKGIYDKMKFGKNQEIWQGLIMDMLSSEPSERPKSNDVLQHPEFRNIENEKIIKENEKIIKTLTAEKDDYRKKYQNLKNEIKLERQQSEHALKENQRNSSKKLICQKRVKELCFIFFPILLAGIIFMPYYTYSNANHTKTSEIKGKISFYLKIQHSLIRFQIKVSDKYSKFMLYLYLFS